MNGRSPRPKRHGRGIAVIVAAVLVAVAVLAWSAGDRAPPAKSSTATQPDTEPPATRPPAEASATSQEDVRTDLAADEGVRTELAATPETVAPSGVPVHVRDADGAPVPNVVVELRGRLRGNPDSGDSFAEASTDALGRAVLVLDPEQRRRLDAVREYGVMLDFEVRVDVPLPDAPSAELGPKPTGSDPIELRLPPFGAATVSVTDADGATVPDELQVYVFWRDRGTTGDWERAGVPWAHARAGSAEFRFLPLGKELRFSAGGTGRYARGEVVVAGPSQAHEVVTAQLRLGPLLPTVAGRLVDEQGVPLAGLKVSIGIASVPLDAPADARPADDHVYWRWYDTDAGGAFHLTVGVADRQDRRRVLLVEQDDARRREGGEVVRRALVALPRELAPGSEVDLGTIPVLPEGVERTLVAGVVVGSDGSPVVGALISAGYWDTEAGRSVRLHRTLVRSGSDGRFEIRTAAAEVPESFTVGAAAPGRVAVSREAVAGTRDLRLVLARGGRLNARIAVPEGVPAQFLVGSIDNREPNQFAGRFGYDGLEPGRHDVTVRIQSSDWVLAHIPGVFVPEAGAADDPRLDGIAVDCRVLRLVVLDVDGAPLANARLGLEDLEGDGVSVRTDAAGRVLAVVPTEATELRIGDRERSATLAWRAEEQVVRLERR